ncbi:MAG: hypothetical protein R2854_19110 [Caldilineaceae bacterium]
MKFVWMFLALVIAVGIAYLIWEEFIVKREQADDGNAERYAEADIKALFDEQRPTGHPSDTDAAAALHSAVEEAEEEIAHAHEHAPAPTEEPTETVLAEEIAATDDAAEAASVADEGEAEVVAARTTGVTTEVIEMAPDNLTKVKGSAKSTSSVSTRRASTPSPKSPRRTRPNWPRLPRPSTRPTWKTGPVRPVS